jgi:hypothetical protein
VSEQLDDTAGQRLARYRTLAARARSTAEKVRAGDLRSGYLELARSWEDLAAQLQREERAASGAIPSPEPDFDVLDQPRCEQCGERTSLIRRTPHPELGIKYELQTFGCGACSNVQSRNMLWSG